MADYDPNSILLALGGGSAALVAAILYARRLFKGMGLETSGQDAAQSGLAISQAVLKDINDELKRHSQRITELEKQVEELTGRLANVRLIALDCYSLANECGCGGDARNRLLDHLKQIIRDA